MSQETHHERTDSGESPHFLAAEIDGEVAAWTEIEPGRFMPRRVRGSNLGRALG